MHKNHFNEIGKRKYKISSAAYVDGDGTGWEASKSALDASFRLQKAFMRQGMLSTCSLQLIHKQTMKYLMGLGNCSIFWFAWVLWDLKQGGQGYRTCHPIWSEGSGAAQVDPLSLRMQPSVSLQQCAKPQHSIPRKNFSDFLFKNPQVLKTGRTGWGGRGGNIFLTVLTPHLSFPSLFLFSLFHLSQAASTRGGGEYVWSDGKLLFCRQENTEALQLILHLGLIISLVFSLHCGYSCIT